eukprot:9737338-Lingulodinium_polyedra.AAC.1
MGFSWSLYFAQHANEGRCRAATPLLREPPLSDHGLPLVLDAAAEPRSAGSLRHFVYVDNLG